MKYIVISANANQEDTREFNDLPAAIDLAQDLWAHLTAAEKKTTTVYVLDSVNPDEEAMDHFDGNTVWEPEEIAQVDHRIVEAACEYGLKKVESNRDAAKTMLESAPIETIAEFMDDDIREELNGRFYLDFDDGDEESFLAWYLGAHFYRYGHKLEV